MLVSCRQQPAEIPQNYRDPISFVEKTAQLWEKAYDSKQGGFFALVLENGQPQKDGKPFAPENFKLTLGQSRNAYAFAHAYMLTGKKEYLLYARRALDYLYSHAMDRKNKGFHSLISEDGDRLDKESHGDLFKIKWSFTQHYALLGIAAMYEATRNESDLKIVRECRRVLDTKLWDNRKNYEGYYEEADYDWSHPRKKGFTPSVDFITTHGLSLFRLTEDAHYKKRLLDVSDQVMKHLVPSMDTRLFGFEESYDSDWKPEQKGFFFIGHVLKTAWCLGRAYLVEPKKEYLEGAEKLLEDIYKKGWDTTYGGPYNFGDNIKGIVTNNEKVYWNLEQAITSGLIMYYITGKEKYLKKAEESTDFFYKHILDHENGGAYDNTTPDGLTPITRNKGSLWKVNYHTIETGYYLYVYGNLFVKKQPVTLYYNITESKKNRRLVFSPVYIKGLKIKSVKYEKKSYKDFNATTRTVHVPAGMRGELAITYEL